MRALAIGGGHGLARSLAGLKRIADEVTAVVTVADDGGSSGRLRRDLGVVPPGDLRMALAALAGNNQLAQLLQYRFADGELDGHSLGNLIVVALADLLGDDLVHALDRLCHELEVPGRVLPCTPVPLVLHASRDGQDVAGQVAVATGGTPDRIWIEPTAPAATPDAVAAIAAADVVVLGPGSLYTSVLPNLLVPAIGDAVRSADAPVVLVANLREQLGETEGLTLADHVDALLAHVPGLRLDAVVAHAGDRPTGGGRPLDPSVLEGHPSIDRLLVRDLLDGRDGHDAVKLGRAIVEVASRAAVRPPSSSASGRAAADAVGRQVP